MHGNRLQVALGRLEARRVELESQIISDLETQFHPTEDADRATSLTASTGGGIPEVFTPIDHPTVNDTTIRLGWID
jgi:hypothetical protein